MKAFVLACTMPSAEIIWIIIKAIAKAGEFIAIVGNIKRIPIPEIIGVRWNPTALG